MTRLKDNTIGHVGGLTPQVKARLRDVPEMNYSHKDSPPRGELELLAPCVFKRYFKNEEQTKQAFTEDGWLKTGDVAEFLENGAVRIVDRVKNIFKLS